MAARTPRETDLLIGQILSGGILFTVRHNSRLTTSGSDVLVLGHDLDVRVLTTDGQLLRAVRLNPYKDYQHNPRRERWWEVTSRSEASARGSGGAHVSQGAVMASANAGHARTSHRT
jgi:hypothetical protein